MYLLIKDYISLWPCYWPFNKIYMYACMYVCMYVSMYHHNYRCDWYSNTSLEFKSGLNLSVNNLCYDDHHTVYLTHHKILPYATWLRCHTGCRLAHTQQPLNKSMRSRLPCGTNKLRVYRLRSKAPGPLCRDRRWSWRSFWFRYNLAFTTRKN